MTIGLSTFGRSWNPGKKKSRHFFPDRTFKIGSTFPLNEQPQIFRFLWIDNLNIFFVPMPHRRKFGIRQLVAQKLLS